MNIMYLTKEVKFHMAHMLANYNGECKNIHGHTYILQVTVFKNLDLKCENSDMIIDFGVLNKIIKEKILDVCDHSFACWKNSTEKLELKFSKLLKENGKKIVEFNFRPTAEMMSKSFFYILQEALKEYNIEIKSVKLWETPTNMVEYTL